MSLIWIASSEGQALLLLLIYVFDITAQYSLAIGGYYAKTEQLS